MVLVRVVRGQMVDVLKIEAMRFPDRIDIGSDRKGRT